MNGRLAALVVGAVAVLLFGIALSGQDLAGTFRAFGLGTIGTPRAWTGTLQETTPLLIAGAGVFLALRGGLFNIGIEGQFLVGGLSSTVMALRFPGPGGLVFGIVAGSVAGGIWALPAGWIKAYRGGHEVISTIMLNSLAVCLTDALVSGPFKDPKSGSPTTESLPEAGWLPSLISQGNFRLSSGLVIGVLLAIGLQIWLKRRVAGYELQAVGANPTAARYAGIDVRGVTMRVMFTSGLIGGLAGAVQALAYEGRFYQGFSPGYGFDSLGVALLAGGSGWLLLPSGFLFGLLTKGGTALGIFGVPKGLTTVALGLVILVAAAVRYRKEPPVD